VKGFLLSPANTGGERGALLLRDQAQFDLAVRLREGAVPVGELYSFISGLYFRGKMAYASAFGTDSLPALVIVPGFGLLPADTLINREQFRAIAGVLIERDADVFRTPLLRDAKLIDQHTGGNAAFVLLGSIATEKYVAPLLEVFDDRLLFPEEFVGRGDMSRGGMMLRCARAGIELKYVPVRGAVRHGKRPPRLPKL
jgi:hypothetical protein